MRAGTVTHLHNTNQQIKMITLDRYPTEKDSKAAFDQYIEASPSLITCRSHCTTDRHGISISILRPRAEGRPTVGNYNSEIRAAAEIAAQEFIAPLINEMMIAIKRGIDEAEVRIAKELASEAIGILALANK